MGSTLGCAECHDHKFDPFKAKDFYAMKAFFADINETGMARDGNGRNGPDAWGVKLAMPTPDADSASSRTSMAAFAEARRRSRTGLRRSAEQRRAVGRADVRDRFERGELDVAVSAAVSRRRRPRR